MTGFRMRKEEGIYPELLLVAIFILDCAGLNVTGVVLSNNGDAIHLTVPRENRDACDTILVLEFRQAIHWDGIAAREDDIYGLADGLS